MAEMRISNTLVNDTSTGEIAYADQVKDRILRKYIADNLDYTATDKGRIPSDIKAEIGVFQERLNKFFLDHWVAFQRFMLDEGVNPSIIDSWYEVKRFLEGLDDDTARWLKTKFNSLDTAIASIDQDGIGTFDISAYNNVEGTYATYANLDTALSAVPIASRRSGMTIRYIDSSTDEYKQYRYILQYSDTTSGNNDFVDTDNWTQGGVFSTGESVDNIGIDSEPTANSNNLVKSVGTKLFIDKKLGNLIYGKAINTSGQEVDAEGMLCTDIIPISNGDTFKYASGGANTINYSIAIYDAEGTMIAQWRGTNNTREVTISNKPTCAYCRASFVESGTYNLTINGVSYVFHGIKDDVKILQGNVQELQENKLDTIRMNVLLGNLIYGKAVSTTNGSLIDFPGAFASVDIPANYNDVVKYTAGTSSSADGIGLVVFDSANNKITDYFSSSSIIEITLPSGTSYIRVTFYEKYIDKCVFTKNNVDLFNVGTIIEYQRKSEFLDKKITELQLLSDYNVGNLIDGISIDAVTGEIYSLKNRITTTYIKASSGDVVKYKAGAGINPSSLVAYGNLGSVLNYWIGTADVREITLPSGTAYITATFAKGTPYSLTINRNDGQGDVNVLVNSRVEKSIQELQGNVQGIQTALENLLPNLILGKAVLSNGTIVSASDMIATEKIVAKYNDSVQYLGGKQILSELNYSLVAYDSSDSVLNYWRGNNSVRTITLPANTAYIRATFAQDTDYSLTINNVDVLDTTLNENLIKNKEQDKRLDLLEKEVNIINTNLIFGKAVLSDGTLVSALNMIATEKIVAKADDSVVYVGGAQSMSTQYYSLVAYDASDSVLNYWRGTNDEKAITLPSNTSYIRATFAQDTDFSLTINNKDVIFDKILNNINLKDKEQDKRLDALELSASDRGHLMPINIFGDILPAPFKEKLMDLDSDLLIVCQGDSLTGLIEECDVQEEPEHCPPGCQYKSWLYLLQQNIGKKKPVCDRVDSQRNGVDVFTKTGTWQNVVTIGRTDIYGNDGTTYGQQRSVSALTFQCSDNDASLAFEFDADTYEKCNIVFSKEPDGVLTKIVIAEGNGYMLVSEDRTNWVEANNYQYSQRTFETVTEGSGNANRESQRRLWMKKATSSVTGTVHISYQRDNSTSYENSYMYVWGIEKWSDYAVFVDNLGRGGRTTRILKANISDIFDRHPDLAIYEMPLANEISHSSTSQTRATLKGSNYYGGYFLGSGTDSFKTRSNNYTTLPLIVVLPHGRSTYFNDNNSAVRVASSPEGEPNTYTCAKQMYSWLKDQLKTYENVSFINLYDALINEALVLDNQINRGFYGAVKAITADSVHLSQYGACLWNKYLAGVFDSI